MAGSNGRHTYYHTPPIRIYLLQVDIISLIATQPINIAQSHLAITPEESKIPVDTLLCPVNFLIQKAMVFKVSGDQRL